jgi:hypothetical protein
LAPPFSFCKTRGEFAMMREFGKPNDAPGAYQRPPEETPQNITLEEAAPTEGVRPFPVEDGETSGNTAKIIGGVIVGLLIVGGGFYAYKMSTATTPVPQQQVALKTPATNHVANDQYPVSAPPVPETSAAPAALPAATPPSPPSPARHPIRAASNEPSSASDSGINAPMTLTPETAPPPQQPTQQSTPQTAMQQPSGTPNVPGASVAQNDVNALATQVPTAQPPADPSRAPTEQAQLPPAQAQESAAQ